MDATQHSNLTLTPSADLPRLNYRTGTITALIKTPADATVEASPSDIMLDLERFCRMFVTPKNQATRGAAATANADDAVDEEDTVDQSLRRTDVARELRDGGLPNTGKEHAMPRPSEKNKKKLRKVCSRHDFYKFVNKRTVLAHMMRKAC